MTFKTSPIEDEVPLVYKGSPITNPVGNAEHTEWNAFLFFHNHFQEEGGCIEVGVTSKGLSRHGFHENLG